MLTYDNNNILTGYIKQMLSSFNLPKYRIYTDEHLKYKQEHGFESPEIIATIPAKRKESTDSEKYPPNLYYVNYLKNNYVQNYINGKWELNNNFHYHYDKKELNQTKKLIVKNNVYDSYTHEYLGEYLRFIRDYSHMNLMPMYNCFSNRLCQSLHLSIVYPEYKASIDTSDVNYKIYMVPVKLFKNYTIAIDCAEGVEICCGFFGKYFDSRTKLQGIIKDTYAKYNSIKFNSPICYTKLNDLSYSFVKGEIESTEAYEERLKTLIEYHKNEQNLKMFIKIPVTNNSSLTILEGDYTHFNDSLFMSEDGKAKLVYKKNHSIINFEESEELPDIEDRNIDVITDLQLLQLNTQTSHPFADRLIEYLIGNVINNEDYLHDNILRAQKVMEMNGNEFPVKGAWSNQMRYVAYDFMCSDKRSFPTNHDSFGYIDKDVEKVYNNYDAKTGKRTSILDVDIYDDLYLDSKKKKGD